jgi:hypothetical protein
MMAGVALSGPAARSDATAKADKSEAAQIKDVKVCPMTGEAVQGNGAGHQIVGEYRVYFCCGGCQPAFNKLSKAEQAKRVAEAVKKQDEQKTKAEAK